MEKRKESLSDIKLCRFCLTQDSSLTSLYDRSRDPILVTLPLKIMACVSIEVFPSDKMPSYICERCRVFMDICYDFKQICRRADESCLQFVQNGVPISAVHWPTSLTKIFQLTKKTSRSINTVVEGGATIEVTSQDMSENDDEEEETFNVKIDGSKCIKVTPSRDKESAASKKAGFTSVSKLSRHVRAHAGDRAYPCKYCNKSFVKSHHYSRHLRVKHEEQVRQARGGDEFRCNQCTESFATQDELYYHSAIHATQNLTCPLCQEKFENVDAVTTHIRTHVNGIEFMCDYCELVFTSKEKLDSHMSAAHDDEWPGKEVDESSMEADAMDADVDEEDEDNGLNVKEEDDHMVVEIKKAEGYMLKKEIEPGQVVNTNSEDSDATEYMDSQSEAAAQSPAPASAPAPALAPAPAPALARDPAKRPPPATKSEATSSRLPATDEKISILRKVEAMKRKTVNEDSSVPQKKERTAKVDSTTNHGGSSDKSLRMLEKELQELKRTTMKTEGRTPKVGEAKSKRQSAHTWTPKPRETIWTPESGDEKKTHGTPKLATSVEKKSAERRPPNKDSKESKEAVARNTVSSSREDKNVTSTKDDKPAGAFNDAAKKNEREENTDKPVKKERNIIDKEDKAIGKEAKGKAAKEDVPSSSKSEASSSTKSEKAGAGKSTPARNEDKTVKNGDTSGSEDNAVRRSTRPSKIKNYASMIRDRTRIIRDEEDDEEDSDEEEEEFAAAEANRKSLPKRQKPATPAAPAPAPAPAPAAATPVATPVRRRGRPRKDATPKDVSEEPEVQNQSAPVKEIKKVVKEEEPTVEPEVIKHEVTLESETSNSVTTSPTSTEQANTIMSPTGQTLKKVPVKALPPGVKPLPLPLNARRELCDMQIGQKMVKVQKIIMTKAEVEAMAKKGYLELKDGTMVLKQGIKLPGGEPTVLRSGLVSQGAVRKVSAIPTRCNFEGEDA